MAEFDKTQSETTENVGHNGQAKDATAPRKGGVFNTLYPPGNRVKGHYKRFWWCDLFLLIVIVLVIVLPIIYVGVPNKAQHDLDHSTLEVTAQEVTDPTPSEIHLKLVTTARSYSSYHPKIDGFRGALFLESTEPNIKPFLYIDIPDSKAGKNTSIIVDQQAQIADADQFIAYNKLVMGSEEFRVALRGRTDIHLSGLPSTKVNYNKVVTMKGLNKLKGLNITAFSILSKPLADGSNMNGTVYIPNPSVYTLDLGNVTMNLSVDGQYIGNSTLPNLVLKPGDNFAPMTSIVDQLAVFSMVTSKYKNGVIPIDISGNSSVSNGQHLPYYEAAIQSNVVRVDLNLTAATPT